MKKEIAALSTGAVISHATVTAGTAGGFSCIVGGIEALSIAVGIFFGMLLIP